MGRLRIKAVNTTGVMIDRTMTEEEWLNGWHGAYDHVPENDAIVLVAELDGQEMLGKTNAMSFERLMEHLSEEKPEHIAAENLPEGWMWKKYEDGSGSLVDPDGNDYLVFDLQTREYKFCKKKHWDFWKDYPMPMNWGDFKEWAEAYIRNRILSPVPKKDYYVTYEVKGHYIVKVSANSIEEAKSKAETAFLEADFGELENINGKATFVEDDAGNYVWER